MLLKRKGLAGGNAGEARPNSVAAFVMAQQRSFVTRYPEGPDLMTAVLGYPASDGCVGLREAHETNFAQLGARGRLRINVRRHPRHDRRRRPRRIGDSAAEPQGDDLSRYRR